MRTILILLCFLTMNTAAHAEALLPDAELREIHFVGKKDGKAVVRTRDGRTAEVRVGDVIGREQGKVVEIGRDTFVVEKGKTRTRMPRPFQVR